MSNYDDALGVNGHLNGHANGNGTALLERPLNGGGEAGVLSMGNGALLPVGAMNGAYARAVDPVPPVPPIPPAPAKPARNPFNKQLQRELAVTTQVCLSALKPDYAGALAGWGITDNKVHDLLNAVNAAHVVSAEAQTSTNARVHATREERKARAILLGSFRTIQSAARMVFGVSKPAHLRDYGVGVPLPTRASVVQVYEGILKQLQTDTLPGIIPEFITQMTVRYNDWKAVIANQGHSQSGATTQRAHRNATIDDLVKRRREIQSAANGVWPPSPANHGTRREFALSPTRHFATPKTKKRAPKPMI